MEMNSLPSSLEFDLIEVSPRVVVANYKDCFGVNAAAIILSNFTICVDTLFYPPQGRAFRKIVESKYKLPVKYLFLTHYHGDHVFGMASFKDIEVFGSQELIKNMKRRMKEQWTKDEFEKWKDEEPELADVISQIEVWLPDYGFKGSHTISDGDLRAEFYHSGGHTGCSAYAYFPAEQVLITGDDLASFDWPYISDSTGNPDRWIASFEAMLKLDVDKVVPGHGPVVDKEHILEHLNYIKSLRELVICAISDGTPPEDIQVPEFYKTAEDWQIPKALEHLHNFYSAKSR
jgi:glyoxylase-like metal-dependent hydrolase (beta-lactamase superfamily II)